MKGKPMTELAIADWMTYFSRENASQTTKCREARKTVMKSKMSDGTYKGSVSAKLREYDPYLIKISICVVFFHFKLSNCFSDSVGFT